MNEQSVFYLISELTQKKGISCILIGGFAVNYYKVTRQTADVDFLITKGDFDKIVGILEKKGYKQILAQEMFVQLKSGEASLLDIDFMFVDRETFMKIKSESEQIKIAGQRLLVPSLNHLLALKLHSIKHNSKIRMSKDLPDIVNLIRINKVNIKDRKFRNLCEKYGNEDIYRRLSEALI